MRSIRLLTLYKQHYLDDYSKKLNCQYSCLGYYDGMSIEEISINNLEKDGEYIYQKKSQSPISELWYGFGKQVGELKGGYSDHMIGIFRDIPVNLDLEEREKNFWKSKLMPFFSIGFVKLNSMPTDTIEKVVEEIEAKQEENIRIFVYYTFDSADLVVLLQSNSLTRLQEVSNKIESFESIVYMHSILCINEKLLEECKTMIPKEWNGYDCNIDEKISICMRMVTSGNNDTLKYLKKLLDDVGPQNIKNYEKIQYSYVSGHENISMIIPDTDVKSLLVLLRQEGFITHQNKVYKNGLYNIETSIYFKKDWKDIEGQEIPELPGKKDEKNNSWCRKMINKYAADCDIIIHRGDESLYACYQALIQTLNMLDQYENFEMSKDIFYILYLPFNLFKEQLEKTLKFDEDISYIIIQEIKKSIREFLDCVNSVIYHIIHTDQIYLMIPGYSGTSFFIPLKLCMMYMWFNYEVVELLKDEDKKKYYCILTPVIETRPVTNLITFSSSDRNRLIRVRLAQRSLFFPRDLMIILSHEIAHYVGNEIRNRKKRLQCIIKSLAYYVSEGIFPSIYVSNKIDDTQRAIFREIKEDTTHRIRQYVLFTLKDYFENKYKGENYYGEEIREQLKILLNEIIATERGGIHKIIYEIPDTILSILSDENFVDGMQYITEIQTTLNRNRILLLTSGVINEIIDKLVTIYAEVFSDMVVFSILECKLNEYKEAFKISEGIKNKDILDVKEHELRLKVVEKVIFDTNATTEKQPEAKKEEEEFIKIYDAKRLENYLLKNIYAFVWTSKHVEEYAKECQKQLKEHFSDKTEKVKELKKMYEMFNNKDCTCDQIYLKILTKIQEYKDKIEMKYNGEE